MHIATWYLLASRYTSLLININYQLLWLCLSSHVIANYLRLCFFFHYFFSSCGYYAISFIAVSFIKQRALWVAVTRNRVQNYNDYALNLCGVCWFCVCNAMGKQNCKPPSFRCFELLVLTGRLLWLAVFQSLVTYKHKVHRIELATMIIKQKLSSWNSKW